MSDDIPVTSTIAINIDAWIERAKADPVAYAERQATEVFLAALGMTRPYAHEVFLKGGILMGVLYESPRQTGDIDFTAVSEPDPAIAGELKQALNDALPRASAALGYPELMCAVQSSKYYPSEAMFPKATGPALKLHVGYAHRGSPQEKHFAQGRSPHVLEIDISFREPVNAIQILELGTAGATVSAYSLNDLIAEKLRALLQQEKRKRNRRQDIYDIASLLTKFTLDDAEKEQLLALLREKCAARALNCPTPEPHSLSESEVKERARKEWETLAIEIGELPDFEECFAMVDAFYRSLPWD